ncbi:hypothetical protein Tco_0858227 [Tanacetum coccineum]|uniref:Xylulose kinase-1 n=1 Tax=Tanacetum coccineum TaxID=301880 RepID=A0ABQ5B8P3_9ASTR
MANLDFYDKHNMVAYLQKSEGSEGYHQIVDFLNTCHIKYALIENPTIYVTLIEQFWQIASASTLENGDMEITSTIDRKVKVVFEASIRRHLKLEDSNGISILPTTDIFEQLALMGNMKKASKGYTGVDTPLFQTMLIQGQILQGEGQQSQLIDEAASTGVDNRHGGAATTIYGLEVGQGSGNIHQTPTMPHDSPFPRVHTLRSDKGRMQPNELMELVTKLSDKVAVLENDLKQTKKAYGVAFTKLIKKVKTLDKTIKTSKARRRAQFVMIHHDVQTQGRQQYDLEPDFEFTAPEEVYTVKPDISTANVPVSTASAEVSTAAESLVYIRRSATKRKDKGSHTLQQLRGYSFDEVLFEATMKRVNTFTPMESDDTVPKVIAGISKRSAEEELDMLKNFDRDDLVKLWDLVRERFGSTEPTDDKERALWVELKRLFEPDTNDLLELQRYMHDPLTWRLYDTCGVHHVSTEIGLDIFMLVEKDYPMTRGLPMLMLINKLQVDQHSEMADELLRKIFILANRPRH